MEQKTAYVSSIPEEAVERVKEKRGNGEKKRAGYYLKGECVGERYFHRDGSLELEYSFRKGMKHGMHYRWDTHGELLSAEPFENGVPHGTAYQWGHNGRLVGTYTMTHGTGIDLWWQDWEDGSVELSEVHYVKDGLSHGFEWWLNSDQTSVRKERHWFKGVLHGIERDWNFNEKLRRGFPRYWVNGERVTKAQYVKAANKDSYLPPFQAQDNLPQRTFPPEIIPHLRVPL